MSKREEIYILVGLIVFFSLMAGLVHPLFGIGVVLSLVTLTCEITIE